MIKKLALLCTLLTLASPAYSADPLAVKKAEMMKLAKQETVALGDNRFLIFSGLPADEKQYGTTVDLVKITGGAPRFDPMFMEDYDVEAKTIALTPGVAFISTAYRFDKVTGMLDYTWIHPDTAARYQFKYRLEGDTLVLQEVIQQKQAEAAPESIYKVK